MAIICGLIENNVKSLTGWRGVAHGCDYDSYSFADALLICGVLCMIINWIWINVE